ncbi:prion-inhibition and propagation-domain-containing protein [Lasiosphaeria ovina]|uniref:Prion-inhibition and propagation-domain-containing protein n=1 Tax=Lasiosphaeria ovina TaxID=92902 RepID=A0AAE0N3M6_9PEZI|nr:prion-inhibition and propagation-domain-containing protein [Lasiosphaeria ovina]
MAGAEVLSVIGLAALFSTCVESFGYFKAAQRMEKDCDILLVKLDIEKTRLLVWGSTIDVFDSGTAALSNETTINLLHRCLGSIESLLTDADRLTRDYGVVEQSSPGDRAIDFVSSNSMAVFRTAWRRFFVRNASQLPQRSLLRRTKWGIYQKETFQRFIHDLKDLIDGLYEIAPVTREAVDRTVHTDIECLTSLGELRLFEAATEDSYIAWSAKASSIIEASESGTVDRRTMEEALVDEIVLQASLEDLEMVDFILELKEISDHPLVVLTGPCLRISSTFPCNMSTIGRDCISFPGPSWPLSHATVYESRHSLPSRIHSMLDLKDNFKLSIEELGGLQWLTDIDGVLETVIFPLARIFIYCALCACLVQTALLVCSRSSLKVHEYFVRPDDRLTSSCCIGQDRVEGLRSIYDMVKLNETQATAPGDYKIPAATKHIDMLWMEERFHLMENEESI